MGAMFKMATSAPSAMRSQYNPGKATLGSVLEPAQYARWGLARKRYALSTKDLEKLRPMYASQELYWRAVEIAGLSRTSSVPAVVGGAAERAGVPTVDTGFTYPLELDRKNLKRRIAQVNASSGADIACFGKTRDVLESDLSTIPIVESHFSARSVQWVMGCSVRRSPNP